LAGKAASCQGSKVAQWSGNNRLPSEKAGVHQRVLCLAARA